MKKINLKRRIVIVFLTLVVFGVGGFIWWSNQANKAQAVWFDDDFGYRKSITLTVASSASDITDLETLLTIDTTGITSKMQSACQDLRFTNQAGKPLPYFIDTCSNNSATNKVWILADLVPKNTTTYTVYMYYGNSSARSLSDSAMFWRVNGLVGYWKMNESSWTIDCSTTSVKDSSAKGYNGKSCPTSTGPAGGATGQYGNAGFFDGSNDYVATSDITQLDSASKFTLSVWFKRRAAGSIIEVTKHLSNNDLLNFEPWSDGEVYMTFRNSGSATDAHFTSNDTSWHHVVTAYDGTQAAGSRIKMYLDGVEKSLTFDGTIPATTANMSGGTFEIGRTQAGPSYTDGTIDEVRLYNRTFSSGEAVSLFNSPGSTATTSDSTSNPTTSFASEEKSPAPVMYWKFDDSQGTSAKDATSSFYNGTLSGTVLPAWQTPDQCVSGSCLYFNGSDTANNGVVTRTQASTDKTVLSGDVTISAWIKPTANFFDTAAQILRNGQGTDLMYGMGYDFTNKRANFQWYDGAFKSVSTATNSVPYNEWSHIEAVRSGSIISIYINGKLAVSSGTGTAPTGTATTLAVGQTANGAVPQDFTGYIDELKVYNYARTADQIKLEYNSAKSSLAKGSGTSLGAGTNQALNKGLVGYWKLDESSGTRADSSGDGYTLSDLNTVTSNPGKFSNGGQFTRANSEALYVSDNSNLSVTGDFTMSGWFYQDSVTSGDRAIMGKADISNTKREFYLLRASPGTLGFYVSSDGSTTTNVDSTEFSNTASVWNFAICWYDSKAQTINIQVNGGKVDSLPFVSTPNDSDSQFIIGAIGNTAGTMFSYFDGRIDEVRVYKRVLSGLERQQLYDFAPAPVGYWNFEEGTGTTNYDLSTSANNLSTTGSPPFVAGKYGKSMKYDGSTSYSAVAATPTTNVSTWTLESWIYPANISQLSLAAYNGNDSGGYGFGIGSGGGGSGAKLQGLFGSVAWIDSGYTFPTANKWYHVAMTRDGTTAKFYVNGVQTSGTSASVPGTVTTKFSVGMQYSSGDVATRFFNGNVDETKIYNYTRTQKQIIEDMNGGHPAGGSPVGSQVGYWKFDEGQGTVAYDSSPTKADGTLTSMSSPASVGISGWNPNGVFGKALSFDGSNDKMAITTNTALSITDQLTISAWIKMQSTGIDERVVISKWNSTGDQRGYALYLNSADKVCLSIDSDGAAGGIDTGCSNTALIRNKWYHVVATFIPSTSINIYLNGKLDNNNLSGIDSSIFASTADFQVGGSVTGWTNLFSGDIDEVKIYNTALTQSEINIDYNRGQSINFGVLGVSTSDAKTASSSAATTYCVPGDTSTCTLPAAEWNFEQHNGTSALDSSGNDLTGTLTGGASWGQGKFGSGLKLTNNGDYVTVADNNLVDFASGDGTIEAWVNCPSSETDGFVVQKRVEASTLGYNLFIGTSNYPRFQIGDGTNTVTSTPGGTGVCNNRWHHLAMTIDRTNNEGKIYVDGVKQGATISISTVTGTISNAQALEIGRAANATSYFVGNIDSVRLFKYVRSQSQVAYDYNRGLPVSQWKMDECQGTILYDSIGTNSATLNFGASDQTTPGTCGTNANTAWYNGVAGKFNYSVKTDGTDDYAQILNPSFLPDQQGSISLWIKPLSTSGGNFFAVSDKDTTFQNIFLFGANGSPTYDFELDVYRGGVLNSVMHSPGLDWTTNSWVNVVLTSNGSSYKFYVNGKRVLERATGGSNTGKWFGFLSGADNASIGSDIETNAVSSPFDGQFDDVKVFNYPLTEYQIRTNYNQGSAVRFGPLTGAP